MRNEAIDGCRPNIVSGALPSGDTKTLDQGATMLSGGVLNGSKILSCAGEILGLLKLFGEGYRLSCMYKCQVLTNFYCSCRLYSINSKEKYVDLNFYIFCFVLFNFWDSFLYSTVLQFYLVKPSKFMMWGWGVGPSWYQMIMHRNIAFWIRLYTVIFSKLFEF